MLEPGVFRDLYVVKKVDFGVYLAEEQGKLSEKVLLPKKKLPSEPEMGKKIRVFLYRDSEDRLIATTDEPLITMGAIRKLPVVSVGKLGAFLYWGLEKDLLLPFKQQTRNVKKGDEVLVALYEDKTGRLCATMNVYKYLKDETPYKPGDWVTGTVYEDSDNFGYFVAVDDKYSALIPMKEVMGKLEIGESIRGRVGGVRDDGRLLLSLREKAYLMLEPDGEKILDLIAHNGGHIDFTDKADPELIRRETGMSKKEFKRAVGHLLKKGKIEIKPQGIFSRE